MRTHRKPLIALTLAAGTFAAGCGAARQTTSSTTAITPSPTLAAEASPTPSASPTPTPTASPKPTATPAPAKGGARLAVSADPTGQLKFTQTTLTAKAGNITIDFTNKATVPHNVAIRKNGGKPIVETPTVNGKKTTAKVKLAPGTYEFYCTVPGHEQAGMKGTLTVK